MNDSIEHLSQIAIKDKKLIIGLMSGTSLDGLDIALCEIKGSGGETKFDLRNFQTLSYPEKIVESLREIVSIDRVSLQKVCLLNSWLADYHAQLILEVLRDWNIDPRYVDCIASHGQTVYHAPIRYHQQKDKPNTTLQIVDGDHIARKTGILTISDFRQKHTAAGGEGAPMVALTDAMLFSDDSESRVLLNIGGIANFTYLPAGKKNKRVFTTDVGPGNTLIDNAVQALFGKPYDEDGAIAERGSVHPQLLKRMLEEPFFSKPLPRTTGPELFNMRWVHEQQEEAGIKDISDEKLIATLTWLTAQSIVDAISEACGDDQPKIYLSGGGMHNKTLVQWIEKLADQPTASFAEIGFNPDAKEAASFAILANETLSGEAFEINPQHNAGRRVNFGKICLPV